MLLTRTFTFLSCSIPLVLAVWPEPLQMSTGSDTVWVDRSLSANFQCGGSQSFNSSTQYRRRGSTKSARRPSRQSPWSSYIFDNENDAYARSNGQLNEKLIAQKAINDALSAIRKTSFVPWKFYTRGAQFEPETSQKTHVLHTILIQQSNCPSENTFHPGSYFSGDEAYTLSVAGGTAQIQSNSTLGTVRALETFKQLVYSHSDRNCQEKYIPNAPITIYDKPHWPHRALHLDIARNSYGPKDVMHTIDAMATAKFSRLHIHATDSQAWPLEIPALPDLALKGAYRPDLIWTTEDLEIVQAYAAQKGIAAVIEIDLPGHSASVHFAYPELVTAFNETDWSTFALEPQSGQLKLNSTKVTEFINTLFNDLLPRTSKYSPIHHMGGDEFNVNVYRLDETVGTNNSRVLQPLVEAFQANVLSHVQRNGLRPMVWQEMILEWNVTAFPKANATHPGTLVQVWKSSEEIKSVLEKGYRVVFGDYNNWYLDCGHGGFINPYPSGVSPPGVPFNTSGGVRTVIKDPFLDYCNPLHNWRHIYVYNPLQNITDELKAGVEGGEVLLWSEQSDPADMDYKLWPRAASAAEVLWSGVRNASMIEAASRRLGEWRERQVLSLGLRASPVQMTWCLMEGGCNL